MSVHAASHSVPAGLGVMLALRGKYHPTQWGKLPRLFPNGMQRGPDPEVLRERFGQFLKTVAFSAGGVLVGQSAGFVLGTWQSARIIRREGNYENIERVMARVRKEIMEQYGSTNPDGSRPMLPGTGGTGGFVGGEGASSSSSDGILLPSSSPPDPFEQSKSGTMTPSQRRKLQGLSSPSLPGSQQSDIGTSRNSDFVDFYGGSSNSGGRNNLDAGQNSRLATPFERDPVYPSPASRDTSFSSTSSFPQSNNGSGFVDDASLSDPRLNPASQSGCKLSLRVQSPRSRDFARRLNNFAG